MTEEEIGALDHPKDNKSRKRAGDQFVNTIYKMMVDGYDDDTIYHYLRKTGIKTPRNTLCDYMRAISQENFPNRKRKFSMNFADTVYPDDVIVINRSELLRYILTIDPKKEKDKKISENLAIIREKFPIVEWVSTAFHEFHDILMSKEPDRIDNYILKYGNTELSPFCNGLKKDIAPVKNAISHPESSGFVEGNNNKFKLIKRIVYGRSGLVNLSKKCKLAFMPKDDMFTLSSLI